jgi:hypothetical protein
MRPHASSPQLEPKAATGQRGRRMRRVFGKHLIRGPDQEVRFLGLEHEILIELFHDVIKTRDGCAAFVARLDPDRVKERQLRDAIFR